MPRVREMLVRLALVVGSVVVAFVLVEGLLRFQEPYLGLMKDRAEWALGRYRIHSVWHHWMRPNQLTAVPMHDPVAWPDPIIYRTNRLGCRDDSPRRKADGVYRILVMGDSFTEGYYVEDTFAETLQRELDTTGSPGSFDVVNCGTTSYSPLLHFLRFRHQLVELQADEVIVNLDLTDVYDDNWRYSPQAAFGPDGEPLYARLPQDRWKNLADGLRFRFYTARLFFGKPTQQILAPTTENVFAYHRTLDPSSERWRNEVGYTLDLLRRLMAEIAESGARVTITMYPYRQQYEAVDGDVQWNRAFEQAVRETTTAEGGAFYSAFEDLRPLYASGAPLYWSDDTHFTPVGQREWGRAFARYYVGRGAGMTARGN